MNVVKVIETFPTQDDCISYLERLRWRGSPECPQCASTHVRRRNEPDTGLMNLTQDYRTLELPWM